MSEACTVVTVVPDESPFASLAGAHLLHEELCTAEVGRIDDEILVVIGVGNAWRLLVMSREVTARRIRRVRRPEVETIESHDDLHTFTSVGAGLDIRHAPTRPMLGSRDLLAALDTVEP